MRPLMRAPGRRVGESIRWVTITTLAKAQVLGGGYLRSEDGCFVIYAHRYRRGDRGDRRYDIYFSTVEYLDGGTYATGGKSRDLYEGQSLEKAKAAAIQNQGVQSIMHNDRHELNTIREIIEEELYDWGQDPLGQKPGYLSPIAADAGVSIREVDRLAAAMKRVEHKNATELERLHYQIGDLIDEMREQVKNASRGQIEEYARAREEWIGS